MTTLTTLFVVGPEEYVEFNESMGSKAFLEHVWDQRTTPLNADETSASGIHLHSAGARISPNPPLRIEFPTIVRLKGRGNKYKPTGRWISWEDLRERNPLALKAPPSLDEFVKRGGEVGTGPKLEAGSWLGMDNKIRKPRMLVATKKGAKKGADKDIKPTSDGWYGKEEEVTTGMEGLGLGGSAESIYAPLAAKSASAEYREVSTASGTETPPKAPSQDQRAATSNRLRQSASTRSLSERFGIGSKDFEEREAEPVPPLPALITQNNTTGRELQQMRDSESPQVDRQIENKSVKRRADAPAKLSLPIVRAQGSASIGDESLTMPMNIAQTPLSATHTPPETPLKHVQRGPSRFAREIPPTPRTEEAVRRLDLLNSPETNGLLLTTGKKTNESGKERASEPVGTHTSSPAAATPGESSASTPTPSATAAATATTASNGSPAKNQIDAMLAKLRQARAGISLSGSSESRWASSAVKEERRIEAERVDKEIERLENEKKERSVDAVATTTAPPVVAAPLEVPKSPPKAPKALRQREADSKTTSKGKNSANEKVKTLQSVSSPPSGVANDTQHAVELTSTKPKVAGNRSKNEQVLESKAEQQIQETKGSVDSNKLDKKSTVEPGPATSTGKPPAQQHDPTKKSNGGSAFSEQFSVGGALPPVTSSRVTPSRAHQESPDVVELKEPEKTLDKSRSASSVTDESQVAEDHTDQDSTAASSEEQEEGKKTAGNALPASETMSSLGNDTSFNWADDDDDEALPDLPEGWGYTPTKSSVVAVDGRAQGLNGKSREALSGSGWSDDEGEGNTKSGDGTRDSNVRFSNGSEGTARGASTAKSAGSRSGKDRASKKGHDLFEGGSGHRGGSKAWAEPASRNAGAGGIKIAGVAKGKSFEDGVPVSKANSNSNANGHVPISHGQPSQRRELFPETKASPVQPSNGSAFFGRSQQQQQQQQQQRPPRRSQRHPDARAPLPPNAMPLSMATAGLGISGGDSSNDRAGSKGSNERRKEPPRAPKADVRAAVAAASASAAAASKEQQQTRSKVGGAGTTGAKNEKVASNERGGTKTGRSSKRAGGPGGGGGRVKE